MQKLLESLRQAFCCMCARHASGIVGAVWMCVLLLWILFGALLVPPCQCGST